MNTIPISHFFLGALRAQAISIRNCNVSNTTKFSFRDPILSFSDTHSPFEIHIFGDPKDQNFRAARAIYTKKHTRERRRRENIAF